MKEDNKKTSVIKEMNQAISQDVGVEVKTSKKRSEYFKKKNEEEVRAITKARAVALGENGLLDILNKGVCDSISWEQVKERSGALYNYDYEACLRDNKFINIVFSTYGVDGNYEIRDGKMTVVLEDEEMKKYGQENTYRQKAIFLNRVVCVKVARIEGNRVYVTPAGSTEQALRYSTKELINSEIEQKLAKGIHPVVLGRVLSVRQHSVMVNILDADIIGFINTSHWSVLYTRSLEGLCKEGDYLEFEVLRAAEKKAGTNVKAWILGRENITPNPWDEIGVESLRVGNIMVVKCMDKPVGKTFWWGVTDRLPGVEVMGDYTYNYSENKAMFVGLSYRCKVSSIERNERNGGYKIKVVPIEVVDEDRESLKSIQRAKGIRLEGNKR